MKYRTQLTVSLSFESILSFPYRECCCSFSCFSSFSLFSVSRFSLNISLFSAIVITVLTPTTKPSCNICSKVGAAIVLMISAAIKNCNDVKRRLVICIRIPCSSLPVFREFFISDLTRKTVEIITP